MTIPRLLRDREEPQLSWQRSVRDTVNGVLRRVMDVGTERPTDPAQGTMTYDPVLRRPLWWDGAAWRDAAGNIV
jgi:hypothetical protein